MSSIRMNIASLMAQRRLGKTTQELARSFERLSSGLRINRAADDVGGLAIAESLNADRRVYLQGIRNLNDGLSLLNVADGALSELSSIVIRIRELAEQSANGTLSNTQRQAIDQEAQELSEEYSRIARTTEVNGLNLFDGSIDELSLQAGYGEGGVVKSSLGGAISDGTFAERISYSAGNSPSSVVVGDINGDGTLDLVTSSGNTSVLEVLLGNGDGSFSSTVSYSLLSGSAGLVAGDFNNDGVLDVASSDVSVNAVSILLGNGDGTFSNPVSYSTGVAPFDIAMGDFNGDGSQDLVTAGGTNNTLDILLGRGDGTFETSISYTTGAGTRAGGVADFNSDGVLDLVSGNATDDSIAVHLGNGDGTFQSAVSYDAGNGTDELTTADVNGDGIEDIVSIAPFDATVNIFLGRGDGTFNTRVSYDTGALPNQVIAGDVNGDGNEDLLVGVGGATDVLSIFFNQGDGTFDSPQTYSSGNNPEGLALGDFDEDGVLDVITSSRSDNVVNFYNANTSSGVGPILAFSLATQADALQAMAPLDRRIEQLALQKGTIGAFQSRVETAINNLQSTVSNYAAAESQIRDVDVAEEAAELIRLQILQQAAAAILGQANLQPSLTLKLLS